MSKPVPNGGGSWNDPDDYDRPAAALEFRPDGSPVGYAVALVLARPLRAAREKPTAAEAVAFAALAAVEVYGARCYTTANDEFRPDGLTTSGKGSRAADCRLVAVPGSGVTPPAGGKPWASPNGGLVGGGAVVSFYDAMGSTAIRMTACGDRDDEPTRAQHAARAVLHLPVPVEYLPAERLSAKVETGRVYVRERGLWT